MGTIICKRCGEYVDILAANKHELSCKQRRKLIYLAAPYTHPDQSIVLDRVKKINAYAAHAFRDLDVFVFSPISHTHPIATENGMPTGIEFWHYYDARMIGHCDELWILQLDGWDISEGVRVERDIADLLGKIIRFKPYELPH